MAQAQQPNKVSTAVADGPDVRLATVTVKPGEEGMLHIEGPDTPQTRAIAIQVSWSVSEAIGTNLRAGTSRSRATGSSRPAPPTCCPSPSPCWPPSWRSSPRSATSCASARFSTTTGSSPSTFTGAAAGLAREEELVFVGSDAQIDEIRTMGPLSTVLSSDFRTLMSLIETDVQTCHHPHHVTNLPPAATPHLCLNLYQGFQIALAGGHPLLVRNPDDRLDVIRNLRQMTTWAPRLTTDARRATILTHARAGQPTRDAARGRSPFRSATPLSELSDPGQDEPPASRRPQSLDRPGELSLAKRGVLCLNPVEKFSTEDITAAIRRASPSEIPDNPAGAAPEFLLALHLTDATWVFPPELDRFMQVECHTGPHEQPPEKIPGNWTDPHQTPQATAECILRARKRQAARYAQEHHLNASAPWTSILSAAMRDRKVRDIFTLSRDTVGDETTERRFRIARTIADLEDSKDVTTKHWDMAKNWMYEDLHAIDPQESKPQTSP